MMGRWVVRISIAAAVLSVLALGLFVGAGWFISSKTDAALARVSSRVKGLELKNAQGAGSFLSKSGTLYISYDMGDKSDLPDSTVSLALNYSYSLGLNGVKGSYSLDRGYGNVLDLTEKLTGLRPSIDGTFYTSFHDLSVKSDAIIGDILPNTPDGQCRITPVKARVSANALKNLDVVVSLDELSCQDNEFYAGRPAYAVNARDLKLHVKPSLSGKSVKALKLDLSLDSFDAGASTIYLIGFKNDEQVKDPSLYEYMSLSKATVVFDLTPSQKPDFMNTGFGIDGNLAFGFPRIRDGRELPLVRVDALRLFGNFGGVNLKKLVKGLKSGGDSDALKSALFSSLSQTPEFHLDGLSFNTQGSRVSVNGGAVLSVNHKDLKIQKADADFSASASERLISDLTGADYSDDLSRMLASGQIVRAGEMLQTRVGFHDGLLTLNGKSLSDSHDEGSSGAGEDQDPAGKR